MFSLEIFTLIHLQVSAELHIARKSGTATVSPSIKHLHFGIHLFQEGRLKQHGSNAQTIYTYISHICSIS